MGMHALLSSGFPGERHIILESWADHTVTSCCFFAALFNDFSSSVMSFPAQSRAALSSCCAIAVLQDFCASTGLYGFVSHCNGLFLAQQVRAACGQLGLTNIEGLCAEGGSSLSISVSVPMHSP